MAKILIIEDDLFMSRMYHKIFTYENYEVETASNGEEGLAKVKEVKPEIILLDIMMPKMNGFQVLEAIKNDSEIRDIPVIMLSNLAGDQDVDEAKQKGASDYIVKSNYTPKQVIEMVKQVLEGKTESNKNSPISTV